MQKESDIKYKKVASKPVEEKAARSKLFKPKIDSKLCVKCMQCVVSCPDSCIQVSGTGTPTVNYSCCKGCLICLRECLYGAITEEKV